MASPNTTMRALRLVRETAGSTPVLSLVTIPMPKAIPNHLLVKVHASAIHPSDIINANGGFKITKFPRIPGRDFAGTVVEGPADRIGEEVYGTSGFTHAFTVDGFHAEYCLVPQEAVAPKPKNISFAQAACVGVPFTTASLTLRRSSTLSSDTVLVLGATGAVGSAVVQLAKSKGCRVLTASRRDSEDINASKDPALNAVADLTQGQGVDVVIDTVGQPELTKAAIEKLSRGGRLAFITAPRGGSTDLTFEMTTFYRQEKTVVGCNTLLYPVDDFAKQMAAMTVDFEKGLLKPANEGEWTKVRLEEAVEAYEKARKSKAEKFVIIMD